MYDMHWGKAGAQVADLFVRLLSERVVLDYDATGNLVGIDIDNASRKVQLGHVELAGMQGEVRRHAG